MPQPLRPACAPALKPARWLPLLAVLGSLACSSGCVTIQPVAPWQKGMLAKSEMTFESDRLEAAFNEHVYSSKEAASGGTGVGGGGCGCN